MQVKVLYGCVSLCQFQVQQLKSVNSLWSDWQLGVREYILIPVSSADEHCSQTSASGLNNGGVQPTDTSASCELVTRQEIVARNRLPASTSDGQIANDATSKPTFSRGTQQNSSISVQDYFSKYDLSLAKIKENVHRMEQSMKWVHVICCSIVLRL